MDGDEDSQPHITIAHLANRPLLQALGDIRLEVRQHYRILTALYWQLRNAPLPVPASWPNLLLEEQQRHHDRQGVQLAALRTIVQP